ncbi:MAG TPA: DASH family cryptochrome [Pseudomonadales bacterium]|nr:DASH family cryptochrome [Pseudomonadales bacterium]
MHTALYWLTNDLRLDDNPALLRAASSDRLIIAYCLDTRELHPHRYHLAQLGNGRRQFLYEGLRDVESSLRDLNQSLTFCYGKTTEELARLIHQHDVGRLVCARQFGSDERQVLKQLSKRFPDLAIEEIDNTTLFSHQTLPYAVGDLPNSFTPFRKVAEREAIAHPLPAPETLPLSPCNHDNQLAWSMLKPTTSLKAPMFIGGAKAAQQHLEAYFSGTLPQHYKEVRNALDGFDNSSKFSAWLNQGSLSSRRLYHRIRQYERDVVSNDSTYWLFFELLWREYFQWLAHQLGNHIFRYGGVRQPQRNPGCFYPERYRRWCAGNTPYPLVNACMKQLLQTGYMSNRGRQIVASCLINELGMDWRYGAAWFEHHLLDFNIGSNWGNWQYIAGVGADPRGGRHFNISKQAATYDPEGVFVNQWSPEAVQSQLDSIGIDDWPLEQ